MFVILCAPLRVALISPKDFTCCSLLVLVNVPKCVSIDAMGTLPSVRYLTLHNGLGFLGCYSQKRRFQTFP